MKICRRQPAFHFELLFPYLFSFVEIDWSYAHSALAFLKRCERRPLKMQACAKDHATGVEVTFRLKAVASDSSPRILDASPRGEGEKAISPVLKALSMTVMHALCNAF
jgi:hypothetical protein